MNIFDILGWRADRSYSRVSKTNVGEYALVGEGSPPAPVANSNFFLMFG